MAAGVIGQKLPRFRLFGDTAAWFCGARRGVAHGVEGAKRYPCWTCWLMMSSGFHYPIVIGDLFVIQERGGTIIQQI